MITPIFVYPHDIIFEAVKQQTSLFSKDKTDKDGNPLFENLVFDEAYLTLFRALFLSAQAEVMSVLAKYMPNVADNDPIFEFSNFSTNRDFSFSLQLPNDFIEVMIQPLRINIRDFIVNSIIYRWMELKQLQEYQLFQGKCANLLDTIRIGLERRNMPLTIRHRLF